MQKKTYFILDFDSTFIKNEGLEALATIALTNNPQKETVLREITDITNQAMSGMIPFDESLKKRLQLLQANKKHIEKLIVHLKKNISSSIKRNKQFFKEYKEQIFIVSGGFREFIIPVAQSLGIPEKNIFANSFVLDAEGNITGFDKDNPLAKPNGKVHLVQSLGLDGDIIVIGDGYTDYQLKELGVAKKFIAFTENIKREAVTKKADLIAGSFDEFLFINKLPMSLSYPKSKINVLLLENIDQLAVEIFEKEGYTVRYFEKSLPSELLREEIKNTHILGIRSRTQFTKDIISSANRLISVGAFCIGTDQIDLTASTHKGIAVFNAPYSNTRSVVELALGEMIMLMRGIFPKSNNAHSGIWEKTAAGYNEIRGKTLGIIGYGNIGSQLSVLAESLGMQVIFYNISEKLALGNAKKCRTMQDVLKKADVVSIHVSGGDRSRNLIGEEEFRMMKDGVVFLNLSRGSIVDTKALAKYLKNGKIKGAAVDVFPKEPKGKDELFVSELQHIPNVILTPHIGGSTEEAQRNIAEYVANKTIDYINTGNTDLSVNIPNIQLSTFKNAHRLLHLHENTPGILAHVTNILASRKINIIGQYLKTNEHIGYVITDVDKAYDEGLIKDLRQIPGTIRLRVLY